MGISITDLVALAKAGYTPGQVKELITLQEKAEESKPQEPQADTGNNVVPVIVEPEKEPEKEAADPKPDNEVDYKGLYEKSQEDLKKAQAANRNADNSGKQSADPEKDLMDVFASYLY